MKICPECYTSVYGDEIKDCPYCGIPFIGEHEQEDTYVIPKRSNFRMVGIFAIISIALVLSIFSVDWVANNGIGLSTGSNCGTNEQCFLTGLAVCDIDKEIKPNSYGLMSAKISEKREGMCLVEVDAIEYDSEKKQDMPNKKICAIPTGELNRTGMDSLFFCEEFENLSESEKEIEELSTLPEQAWAEKVVDKTAVGLDEE